MDAGVIAVGAGASMFEPVYQGAKRRERTPLEEPAMRWSGKMTRGWAGRFVFTPLLLGAGCMTVPTGHVAVLWTPGGLKENLYREGEYLISPLDNAALYDSRSQEHDERIEVLAVNGLRIALDASVRYHVLADELLKLDRELGPDYYAILIGPTLRSQARRVVGRYTPEEIYSSQRELIEREIREGIEKALQGRHIQLEAILIRDVVLPGEIQRAINDKLQAEQASLKEKYLIDQAKQEMEKARIQAESEAERMRLRAQGEADARRIAAKAADDANKLLEQHVTDKTLKWQQLQAIERLAQSPSAKVILLPEGKTVPLLQIQ